VRAVVAQTYEVLDQVDTAIDRENKKFDDAVKAALSRFTPDQLKTLTGGHSQ
jgi:hypothetical protein